MDRRGKGRGKGPFLYARWQEGPEYRPVYLTLFHADGDGGARRLEFELGGAGTRKEGGGGVGRPKGRGTVEGGRGEVISRGQPPSGAWYGLKRKAFGGRFFGGLSPGPAEWRKLGLWRA